MQSVGRMLLMFGVVLVVVGGVMLLLGRLGIGGLPGDFTIRRGNFRITMLLGTSLVISVVLTLLLNLLLRR